MRLVGRVGHACAPGFRGSELANTNTSNVETIIEIHRDNYEPRWERELFEPCPAHADAFRQVRGRQLKRPPGRLRRATTKLPSKPYRGASKFLCTWQKCPQMLKVLL